MATPKGAVTARSLGILIVVELLCALALVSVWAGFAHHWWPATALGASMEMFMVAMYWWCDSTSGTLAFMLAAVSLVATAALHIWQISSPNVAD